MTLKLYRKQYKPMILAAFSLYQWEEVDKAALHEVMPHNDRLDELIEKMAQDGHTRWYGKYAWKVRHG